MSVNSNLQIQRTTAHETRGLRQKVLRPHQTADELVYDGDDWPESAHLIARIDGQVVGIASVYPQGEDGTRSVMEWRLRGMATVHRVRGQGVGRALWFATVAHAREKGGKRYWCNARVSALWFYESMGMSTLGEEFTPPGLGPHVVMQLTL